MRNIAFMLSLLFVSLIPWEGVIEFPGLGTAAKLIGFAMAACWLASVVSTGGFRKPGLFHIMVCLFVLWNLASVFWSADPDTTVTQGVRWLQLLVMVFIVWDLYTTREALLAGLQAFILGEYVTIGIALSKYFSGEAFYTHYQRFSAADQMNPDGFGFIVVLGIPVAFYLAASKTATRMNGLLRWINFAYIPAAFVGLALSGTRAALIAAIPGMAFGLATVTRVRLSARIGALLLLTAAAFVLVPYIKPLRSFQRLGTTYAELTEGDLNNRINNWREGLVSFEEHPLIGVGSSMYRTVNRWDKLAHNSFLSVLVELGLVGLALFGIILTIAVISAWDHPKWDARFWLAVLMAWGIGASALTYEYRKATWLFLTLVIASAAFTRNRDDMVPLVEGDKFADQSFLQDEISELSGNE